MRRSSETAGLTHAKRLPLVRRRRRPVSQTEHVRRARCRFLTSRRSVHDIRPRDLTGTAHDMILKLKAHLAGSIIIP